MIPDSAAERRQNVATAGGRGCHLAAHKRGAAKDSAAAPRLMPVQNSSTAFSRGYILPPLRGWNRIIQNSMTSGDLTVAVVYDRRFYS